MNHTTQGKLKTSLRRRVMLALATVVFLAVMFITAIAIRFVYQTERNAWQSRQREESQAAARAVESLIEQVQDDLRLIGLLEQDYLLRSGVLTTIVQQNNAMLEVIRLDRDGNLIVDACYHETEPVLGNLFTIPQSTWFQLALAGQLYVSDLQISAVSKPYVILAAPASDGGVVAARLRMDLLWDVVESLQIGQARYAYVIDRRGYIIAHPNREVVLANTNIGGRPEIAAVLGAPDNQWSGSYRNFEGQNVLGISQPIAGSSWVIVSEIPRREATMTTSRALVILGGGTLLLGLFTVFSANRLLVRLIVAPLERLRDGAERVGYGDLDFRLESRSADEIGQVAAAFNDMAIRLKEREAALAEAQDRLRDAFSRYVPSRLVDQVIEHGVSLGGETVEASVLFADIRGFTALAEQISPAEAVDLLNRYFAAVEPAIAAEKGWIAGFGGDSLLAVFGAPIPLPDHARHAVRAAMRIHQALAQFNACQRQEGGPCLRVGIGIASGEMVAGSIGTPERMEYTVIGDIVNTAARLDELNKQWGTDILISETVYKAVSGEVSARPLPLVDVKGKSEPLKLYALQVMPPP